VYTSLSHVCVVEAHVIFLCRFSFFLQTVRFRFFLTHTAAAKAKTSRIGEILTQCTHAQTHTRTRAHAHTRIRARTRVGSKEKKKRACTCVCVGKIAYNQKCQNRKKIHYGCHGWNERNTHANTHTYTRIIDVLSHSHSLEGGR